MAFKLILVRHAKSSWKNLDQSDHDRPLNKRGRASAIALGDWLRKEKMVPDQVLCSTAARTRETYELMGFDVAPVLKEGLYHASADVILRHIQGASGQKLLLLGHNPGIGECAERLARKLPAHARFLDYPTGATTVFKFDADTWDAVRFGSGKVKKFTVPRDLL
ncbi:histidine phosphatase family protein [Shimia sp. SDUM112013]|uniref:SixA phosphatase family protein n=1 Tax=Shimia sp. SDUM112013 TaxID=3136160 RepID=UPI0032EF9E5A